jgi:hypothetical protein
MSGVLFAAPGIAGATGTTSVVTTWSGLVSACQTTQTVVLSAAATTTTISAPTGQNLVVPTGKTCTLDLHNTNLNISHPANNDAAIQVEGALTIETTATGTAVLVATASGTGPAGIGGDYGGSGGTVTITGGTVRATGGYSAPGIGAGAFGSGGTVTITGGTVTATSPGGYYYAGIGGGITDTGGTVTISGGTVTATGGFGGAGIGGAFVRGCRAGGRCGWTVAITGGTVHATGGTYAGGIGSSFGNYPGGTVTIDNGATVTATAGPGGSAVGTQFGLTLYWSLTNAGTLTLKGNETIRSGAHAVNTPSGVIHLDTSLNRSSTPVGTLVNQGTMLLGTGGSVTGVTVTKHNYAVTYTVTGTPVAQPSPQTLYAASFDTAQVTLPPSPHGWFDTHGHPVTNSTDLTALFGEATTGPTSVTLYPTKGTIAVTTVGGSQTYGSSSPAFTGTYTKPGGATITGTITCTTVTTGTKAINSSLAVGSYTIKAATCSGLRTTTGGWTFTYTAKTAGFSVTPAQPVPAITSLSRTSGPTTGGNQVIVTGTGFSTVKSVKFATSTATFTVKSATQLVTTSPVHAAGTVRISVTTPGGTSPATSNDLYTYVVPPPVVAGIQPPSGPNIGGTSVTVTGSGFTGATTVFFGAAKGKTISVNAAGTQLTVKSPAGTSGTSVNVQVKTPVGESPAVSADLFTYGPTITSLSRTSGPVTGGTKVTITGTGFSTVQRVKFGTSTATFTVKSSTQIVATSPPHTAGQVQVSVTTAAGTTPATAYDLYTY